MNDRFGQVMMENLSQRGCGLPGVASCKGKFKNADLYLMLILDLIKLTLSISCTNIQFV